ncbi:MAG: flagellar motor switch protein FliN [Planctomyces sp.]|nr:flagellar motor switch protein FliN [Planctomyces sp.]
MEPTTADPVVEVQPAEFPPMASRAAAFGDRPLSRFYDVKVTVTVELGRTSLPLSEMLKLGEGAVIELNRGVSEPVDLVADGVLLARGEIVVVDDCYGIRITEVNAAGKPDGPGRGAAPGS